MVVQLFAVAAVAATLRGVAVCDRRHALESK